jgi:pSer/pThr/pTyr-binding forkhead associated (FHA) protein
MVVVSGIWVKNVATYPTPAINDMVISNENKMTAKAVLICRPNSHPFQERTLALDQPVKVGRSVARARATATNAIFDCKVLSRHHALLWYENGKFYLQVGPRPLDPPRSNHLFQDTKSSNGTFVNNNRLAAETEHHEVSSGDIVQFGVDVIENNRKVTHGCIIATLKLFLPDGKEAKASPSIVENNSHVVPLDELYKLHQIIQEATQREQCLETKLTALQSVVDEARKSAEESWQAYVGEERLLSRVSALETQLQQAGKNWGEDKYREEVTKLQEDSATYQVAAKEALEKLHAERLQALSVATEQERCRISAEQEALLAREQLSQTQQELEVGSVDRGVAIGR